MFRSLANSFFPPAPGAPRQPQLFLVHPAQLGRWLEEAWAAAGNIPAIGGGSGGSVQLGSPTILTDLDLPVGLRALLAPGIDVQSPGDYTTTPTAPLPLLWDHLAYAYLIESTGAYEILAEVVRRLSVGESLGQLSPASVQWARATEELFFHNPPAFSIGGLTSHLRPDQRVSRRNAYWRMFAMDLAHGMPRGWSSPLGEAPWRLDVGNGVNATFREKWTELLRQTWLGFENAKNQVGPNSTDREYVALLCQALDDMLGMRRRGGNLAREEFWFVATMSWFHLTVEYDTPIVVDLQATGTSPEARLAKIGERVGMLPAARSRELFELAEPMSALLWAIEFGSFNKGTDAENLYLPLGGIPTALNREMNRIVDLWQSATGERVKDRGAVGTATSVPTSGFVSAQPLRAPSPATPLPTAPLPTASPMSAPTLATANGRRA